nr:hypothetical protein BaRGS_014870 [Batillaria attramentaria]
MPDEGTFDDAPEDEAVSTTVSQKLDSEMPEMGVGTRMFPGVTCHNKKDGRKEAADMALRTLIAEGQYSAAAPTPSVTVPAENMTHFDKVAALTHQTFNSLIASIPENLAGRKVIAGLVMKRGEDDVGIVISIGTGNRCITGDKLSLEGNTVNDSHAEIITRRGFMRFLYQQLETYEDGKSHDLFERGSSGKLRIKQEITFHLYISTAPSGVLRRRQASSPALPLALSLTLSAPVIEAQAALPQSDVIQDVYAAVNKFLTNPHRFQEKDFLHPSRLPKSLSSFWCPDFYQTSDSPVNLTQPILDKCAERMAGSQRKANTGSLPGVVKASSFLRHGLQIASFLETATEALSLRLRGDTTASAIADASNHAALHLIVTMVGAATDLDLTRRDRALLNMKTMPPDCANALRTLPVGGRRLFGERWDQVKHGFRNFPDPPPVQQKRANTRRRFRARPPFRPADGKDSRDPPADKSKSTIARRKPNPSSGATSKRDLPANAVKAATLRAEVAATGPPLRLHPHPHLLRQPRSQVYEGKWRVFTDWCSSHELSPYHLRTTQIADFLLWLRDSKNLAPITIKGYRAMLSDTYRHLGIADLGADKDLSDIVASFELARPAARSLLPRWNLPWVLTWLNSERFEPLELAPLEKLTKKTCFLLALASASRVSELHALSMDPDCLQFAQDGSVRLTTHPGFLAKNRLPSMGSQVIRIPSLKHVDPSRSARVEKKLFSRVAKRCMYDSFKQVATHLRRSDLLKVSSYRNAKLAAQDFQTAKAVLMKKFQQTGNMNKWQRLSWEF